MNLAVSRSAAAATGRSPSLFSPTVGMSGSADIRILSALDGGERATRQPRRVRRALITVVMGSACIGLLSIGWGFRVGESASDPVPLADGDNRVGLAVRTAQMSGEPKPALPSQAITSPAPDGLLVANQNATSHRDVAAKSVEVQRQAEGRDRAAVIIDAVAPSATPRIAPAVPASKVQGRRSPSRAVTERRKTAARPAVKTSALRVNPTRAGRPTNAEQIADPIDPDVRIIEAIVTRSR